jgi:hypothetical protein
LNFFMRATPPAKPRRAGSIAVDWRDCAWSPPIVVRIPEAASCRLEIKPPVISSSILRTSRRNRIYS